MELKYIEPAMFLYLLTLYLNVPTEKEMVYRKACINLYNETFCETFADVKTFFSKEEDVIQAESAKWNMYLGLVKLIPTVISTICLGVWSDGVGRKNVILLGLFGETLYAISCFVNTWFFSLPLPYLFIGSVLTGFCGNLSVIMMGVLAYIGDVTTPETRTIRITILDALSFSAAIISLISGGIILEKLGFLYVYAIDIGLYMIIMMYMLIVRESYVATEIVKLKDVFCGNKLKTYVDLFNGVGDINRVKFMLFIGCFCTLFFIITGTEENVFILYLLHAPLTFTSTNIGYTFAMLGFVKVIGAIILSVIIKYFKWKDSSLIFLCSMAVLGFSLSLAFSKTNSEVYLSLLWGFGMATGASGCRSALSKMVLVEELGKLNSIICTLQSMCQLVASIVLSNIYEYTVNITPSYTLYIVGGFCFVPVLLSVILKVKEKTLARADNERYDTLT